MCAEYGRRLHASGSNMFEQRKIDRPSLDSQFTARVRLVAIHEWSKRMSDDLSERGSADRVRVNVNEEHERRYWSTKFGVSEQALRDAVARVGVMADDVEKALKK